MYKLRTRPHKCGCHYLGLWTLGPATHTRPLRMPCRYQMYRGPSFCGIFLVFAMFCSQHFSGQYFLGVYHRLNGGRTPAICPAHVSKGPSGHVSIWWSLPSSVALLSFIKLGYVSANSQQSWFAVKPCTTVRKESWASGPCDMTKREGKRLCPGPPGPRRPQTQKALVNPQERGTLASSYIHS